MEPDDLLNLGVAIVGLAVAAMAIVSAEYRPLVIITGVVLLDSMLSWRNYHEIDNLIISQRKLEENLDVQKQIMGLKAEIRWLKRVRR